MIVDKRKYSSWQKIYATYEGNMARGCIYSPAFILIFFHHVSTGLAG